VRSDDDLAGIRRVGRPPRLTDGELVCLAVAEALLGDWNFQVTRYSATAQNAS